VGGKRMMERENVSVRENTNGRGTTGAREMVRKNERGKREKKYDEFGYSIIKLNYFGSFSFFAFFFLSFFFFFFFDLSS
jgi:hypothetical protein